MTALITAEELRERLGSVVLVDVQWNLTTTGGPPGRDLYDAGHVPGAHHVDLDAELSGPPGPRGRHPLPTAHTVQEALRRCGADDDSTVVVYDQGPGQAAARAWWVLCWAGAGPVLVLDGGLAAWRASGGEVTADVPPPGAGRFVARPGGMPVLDAEGAAEVARVGVLLDARSAERYAGEVEPIDPVAGHVPGAVSAPVSGSTGPDGRLLPHHDLRERYAGLGVRPGTAVGAYCGSGVTAAQHVLALHEIGVEAPLYVGSWSHWVTDPSRPVATGR